MSSSNVYLNEGEKNDSVTTLFAPKVLNYTSISQKKKKGPKLYFSNKV